MTIPRDVLDRVRAHAEETYPEECCGFLVGVRSETAATDRANPRGDVNLGRDVNLEVRHEIPAANAAPEGDRTRTFTIEPKVLLDTMRTHRDRDDDVVGFYHSHPHHPAELSPTDLKFASNWPKTMWLIVPVDEQGAGEERAWWVSSRSDDSAPAEMSIHRRDGHRTEHSEHSEHSTAGEVDRTYTPRGEST